MAELMIYGAYGYTGRLIAEKAVAAGLGPVLAGRDGAKLRAVAGELGCEAVVVGLDDAAALEDALASVKVVIHAAGPFEVTSAPMVAACLATGTHYLDITGEISVLAACAEADAKARAAGVMLMPGCGFDVVPTDCLARMLADAMPDASALRLAFAGIETPSRGTMRTAIASVGQPVQVRRGGRLADRDGPMSARIDFGNGPQEVLASTWGDIVTAAHTTGIENIEVFIAPLKAAAALQKLPMWLKRLLAAPLFRPLLNLRINSGPLGPDARERETGQCILYGRVTNAGGDAVEMRLRTVEAYELTSRTAVAIARNVLGGNAPVGFQTPAGAYGADLILQIDGSRVLS